MKKIYFVYNPFAGKGKVGANLNEIIRILAQQDNELTVVPTVCGLDAKKRIENLPEGYDLVVCSGGDGTLDEVVSGMMTHPREQRVPIGYIPSGTTNDFARSLQIPQNMPEAARIVMAGRNFPCDIGSFNNDYFVYIAAFGMFTDVSYTTKQEFKQVLGHMAYVLEGVKRLYNVKSYRMKISSEEQEFEGDFLFGMVTNSKSVAGFEGLIDTHMEFDDGEYEAMFIKRPKNPIEIQEIITALIKGNVDERYMYSFRTKKLSIEAEAPVPWTLDGEYGGDHQQVSIVNNQRAVDIVVKKEEIQLLDTI